MNRKTWRSIITWIPLILYCLLIYLQSSVVIETPQWRYADKVSHFLAYALLGILVLRGMKKLPFSRAVASVVMALVFSCFFALLDELHQLYVPGRHPDRLDLFFDALGSFTGITLYQVRALVWKKGGGIRR